VVPRGNALLADVSSEIADTAMLTLSPEAPLLRKTSLKAGHKDSVASVAKRYHVSAAQVAEWNQVGPGASFAPGQTIILYTAVTTRKPSAAGSQTVPGGPRGTGATRTASSAKGASSSQTARAGKDDRGAANAGRQALADRRLAAREGGGDAQRRSTKAWAMVPRSTYSSSLPIGTPRASRMTRTPRDCSASPSTCAVAALGGEVGRQDDLLDDAVAGRSSSSRHRSPGPMPSSGLSRPISTK
jgi:hypothetical protein